VELSAENGRLFFIPEGFAHGFYVTSHEGADFLYRCSDFYEQGGERGFRWDDPKIGITFPITATPIVSQKDLQLPYFSELNKNDFAIVRI